MQPPPPTHLPIPTLTFMESLECGEPSTSSRRRDAGMRGERECGGTPLPDKSWWKKGRGVMWWWRLPGMGFRERSAAKVLRLWPYITIITVGHWLAWKLQEHWQVHMAGEGRAPPARRHCGLLIFPSKIVVFNHVRGINLKFPSASAALVIMVSCLHANLRWLACYIKLYPLNANTLALWAY